LFTHATLSNLHVRRYIWGRCYTGEFICLFSSTRGGIYGVEIFPPKQDAFVLKFQTRKVLCRGGTNKTWNPLSINITRITQSFYKTKHTTYVSKQKILSLSFIFLHSFFFNNGQPILISFLSLSWFFFDYLSLKI
jgi:hypothetical protein